MSLKKHALNFEFHNAFYNNINFVVNAVHQVLKDGFGEIGIITYSTDTEAVRQQCLVPL